MGIWRESDKELIGQEGDGTVPERDKNRTGKRWELCRKEIRIGQERDGTVQERGKNSAEKK
jgi:hypothetical protein